MHRFPRFRRLALLSVAALLTTLTTAGAAGAATYPVSGGNAFAADGEGWASSRATCGATVVGSACTQQNAYSGTAGNPAGSLSARTEVLVNALGLFTGESTWRSPGFAPADTGAAGTLTFDRRVDVSGLAALNPSVTVRAVLVDEGSGTETLLDTETLAATSGWTRRSLTVPAGALGEGLPARIELRGTVSTTSSALSALGAATIGYDNVSLELPDPPVSGPAPEPPAPGPGTPEPAGPGSGGSPGVLFVAGRTTNSQFVTIMNQTAWTADQGRGPGGTVVAAGRCTIVGTPGRDRIKGGPGNDVICGLGGNDVIDGGGGRDLIDGGAGNDRLQGGPGGDVLIGAQGRDRLSGGSGGDRLGGGAKRDRLVGGSGNDRLHGGSGSDRVLGSTGNDVLRGGKGRDRFDGGRGRDRAPSERRARRGVRGEPMKGVERARR